MTSKQWWRITIAYAIAIAVLSLIPVVPPAQGRLLELDKLLHLCEYLLLAWCVAQAAFASGIPRTPALIAAFLVSMSYGAFLEWVQGWLPYRHGEWADVVANTAGSALGVWLGLITTSSTVHRPQSTVK